MDDSGIEYDYSMKAISLFSGCGGFDIGFIQEGFEVLWANDFNEAACKTYRVNIGNHIKHGDIKTLKQNLFNTIKNQDIDIIFGGPPCQGFSIAGKMDVNDSRSQLVWEYFDIIKTIKPKAFVMENVAALGNNKKWNTIRDKLIYEFKTIGYQCDFIVINVEDFNVPQQRTRVFFIGFKSETNDMLYLNPMLSPYKQKSQNVRNTIFNLGQQKEENIAQAKIIFAKNPVLGSSPYNSFLVNGGTVGGFINLNDISPTLTASMGGNLTPIIDTKALYNGENEWVLDYYRDLKQHKNPSKKCPERLRRLSILEAAAIQTFPLNYNWIGSKASKYKQIGNAVPCNMANALAKMVKNVLKGGKKEFYCQKNDLS